MHLTNFSIQKKADGYIKNMGDAGVEQEEMEEEHASKWSLEQLKAEYEKMDISYEEVFSEIKKLCIKTLMAVEPSINTSMRTAKHKNQCFEVYGFDVMVDSKLRPWLLEVNVAPSLSSSSPYDKQVKTMLLCDTLHLVGFKIFDSKQVAKECKDTR